MSVEIISILVLIAVFILGTTLSINMGVLAFVAAFAVGTIVVDKSTDDIVGGFPSNLFVILVGVTYLFAIAKSNGTVDWLVRAAIRVVGGRVVAIPWVMFLTTAVLTALGAVVPAAVAIIAPIAMGFATRYKINPVLMGLLVINGASAGGFSPISIFGSITNGVVERSNLPGSPMTLFIGSFVFNLLLSIVVFVMFGGRQLLYARAEQLDVEQKSGPGTVQAPVSLDHNKILTLIGIVGLAVGALFFDLDVGLLSLTVVVVLTLVSPSTTRDAVDKVAWSTVLLICGIVTYVSLLEDIGTVDYLGHGVASIGVPLLGALLICFIGGAVSAFASTTGILGALIPLAVPFLQTGQVGAIGLITALALSSSVVDASPFSTSGALTVASSPPEYRELVFKRLMAWGFSMILVAPIVTWLVLVVPGWL
ncbi:di/tricarboxylate transporter [Kibdelosporangium banguiense]|uniref:Di/tricarboxylate transporter n=1 Tax=Kibdelosporangium banguiense TaxID=1365924 RepID=A0ABS4TIN0_9PSEU|nr:SLC13 family permease [Kibdelosporangium banguiense]MBP2324216.1 di/tricarboxylate transporter [Kibdelosporangium banguiense]